MPSSIEAPNSRIPIEPLTQQSFAPFGTVIQNPELSGERREAINANQGSALKYLDISDVDNFYYLAPSQKASRPAMTMFVSKPRQLRSIEDSASDGDQQDYAFDVKILERHPFTTQTFIPLGLAPNDPSVQYLVIVAPTLPISKSRSSSLARPKAYPTPDPKPKKDLHDTFARARPAPFTNETTPPTPRASSASRTENPNARLPKGRGMPDLKNARAFLADGSQAVTYAAGTWHAPMVVIGQRPVDFVVVQFVNGVDLEDCEEVELKIGNGSEGLAVTIDSNVVSAGSDYVTLKPRL